MEKLKLPEVLKKLEGEGIDITKRTFEFYQRLGLLPKPKKQVGKRGRGVYGYYDYQIVATLLKFIYEMKEKGYTLAYIIERGESKVIKKYKSVLNKWGFSDYSLPEMSGLDPEKSKRIAKEYVRPLLKETIKEHYEKNDKTISEEALDIFAEHATFDKKFEEKILEDLRWWYADKAIEAHALEYINNKASDLIGGLIVATLEIAKELEVSKDKTIDEVLYKIYRELWIRIIKAEFISSKANARLADITGEKYKNCTKEKWEELAKRYEEILEKTQGRKEIKKEGEDRSDEKLPKEREKATG